MTSKHKRFLFYAAILVFLILSAVITTYATGYRYDFLKNRFVKTGSLYLSAQTSATVFLNDKKSGNTSFLTSSYSENGILPREHKVRLEKEDYHIWQKTVLVQEGLLSSFPNIYLVKENPVVNIIEGNNISSSSFAGRNDILNDAQKIKLIADYFSVSQDDIIKTVRKNSDIYVLIKFGKEIILYKFGDNITRDNLEIIEPELIDSGVENFIFSGDGNKIAWYSKTELWVVWLKDTSYQPHRKAGDKELIIRTSSAIRDIKWFHTNEHLFVLAGNSLIDFVEIDTRGEKNTYRIYKGDFFIDKVEVSRNSKQLYIFEADKIFLLEI